MTPHQHSRFLGQVLIFSHHDHPRLKSSLHSTHGDALPCWDPNAFIVLATFDCQSPRCCPSPVHWLHELPTSMFVSRLSPVRSHNSTKMSLAIHAWTYARLISLNICTFGIFPVTAYKSNIRIASMCHQSQHDGHVLSVFFFVVDPLHFRGWCLGDASFSIHVHLPAQLHLERTGLRFQFLGRVLGRRRHLKLLPALVRTSVQLKHTSPCSYQSHPSPQRFQGSISPSTPITPVPPLDLLLLPFSSCSSRRRSTSPCLHPAAHLECA